MSKKEQKRKKKAQKHDDAMLSALPQSAIDAEFYITFHPGSWCPACGQEQPADTSCGECYTPEQFGAGKQENLWRLELWAHLANGRVSMHEVDAIQGMWRFL